MHNPVRWVDPTGLSAAIPMAMLGTGGLLGPVNPLAGLFRSSPPVIPTTIPPINVTRQGNNVTIDAVVRIHGDVTAARRQAVTQGIINHWSGDIGTFNVTVNITDIGQGTHFLRPGQGVLDIEIRNRAGESELLGGGSLWSIMNPGNIVLYTHVCPLSPVRAEERYTMEELGWVAAHEFGHALGIEDGWGFGREGRGLEATELGNYYSIMVGWMHSVTELDIIFALRAERYDTWQRWSDNTWIVETFGIPR